MAEHDDITEVEAFPHDDLIDPRDLAGRSFGPEIDAQVADLDADETLIADNYFETYARDLADDIGVIPAEHSWPTSCIDWEQAARELRMDYTAWTIDGQTYWSR